MPIPDYETLMLPILNFLDDGIERKTREIISHIIKTFEITNEESKVLIPSGRAKLIDNRVGWACTYLRKAGLIESPQRSINKITSDGKKVVDENPQKIDGKYLNQFNKFQEFRQDSTSTVEQDEVIIPEKTPEEIIGIQSELINKSIRNDLLDLVCKMEPSMFEQLVIDLLLAIGYGGSVEDAGSAIGQTNDGGIDGVIKEDVLGLDTIFVQAKKWQKTVAIKEVRDFAGALLSKKSNKGVFITTSDFPKSAHEFVSSIDRKIILIDGKRMAELMLKYNLGVSIKNVVEIKEIDNDYFTT
jgi:restriction system protein